MYYILASGYTCASEVYTVEHQLSEFIGDWPACSYIKSNCTHI